jgi:hypothetical protein
MRTLARTMIVAVIVVSSVLTPMRATAEPLPPYSLGAFIGGTSGTGADARRLGYGPVWGVHAAWQPMSTEQRLGWSLKWTVQSVLDEMYNAEAARITDLSILQMDVTPGIRIRPGVSPHRYLTLRAGAGLFRTNQVIPPDMHRAFIVPVANLGFEHYLSSWMLTFDVRYNPPIPYVYTPTSIALTLGMAKIGP